TGGADSLATGTYTGTLTVKPSQGATNFVPITVSVTLVVSSPTNSPVVVAVTPPSLNFTMQQGNAAAATSQSIVFIVSPNQGISYNVISSVPWINGFSNGTAQNTGGATFSLNPFGSDGANSLAPGTYIGTLTISPTPGSTYFFPVTVDVTLV